MTSIISNNEHEDTIRFITLDEEEFDVPIYLLDQFTTLKSQEKEKPPIKVHVPCALFDHILTFLENKNEELHIELDFAKLNRILAASRSLGIKKLEIWALKKAEIINTKQSYTWEEICKHKSADDCWLLIDGKVYDLSNWVPFHPGGDTILNGCASPNATYYFELYHANQKAFKLLNNYYIGVLDEKDKDKILSEENPSTEFLDILHKYTENPST